MPDRSHGDDAPAGTSPHTSTRGAEVGERSPRRRATRAALALAGVVVTYYAAPVEKVPSSRDLVFACVGLLAGLGVLVWVTVRQLRVMTQVEAGDPRVRLDVLGLVVVVVVPLFALGYYALEQADPDQFADLATKTDALYFALSTLATVGFGDVHATEQLSRALVTLQMAFDVVFVTALASILTTQLRARAGGR